MAAAAITRKRPAPDGACPAAAAKKPAPYKLRSIHDYETLEELGKGSYGVVVKARDGGTGDTVAVKLFRAPDAGAFVREAECLAACRGHHPSIVQIRDVTADAVTGELFLVMELVGPSLRSLLLATRGPFSDAETRGSMRQLLGAAATMHGAGIINRDIKPANILVGPGGALKLCDFGLAAPALPAGTPYPEPRVGTMRYRSPEQLQGSRCYCPAADVWALGCVMAELLTGGEPLFGEADTEEVLVMALQLRDKIVKGARPDVLSPSGAELWCGLLCFDHEQRLTAAEALKHRWFTEDEEAEGPAGAEAERQAPLLSAA